MSTQIENFTDAQGVALYEALTRVSTRDSNIGSVRSREDAERYFPVTDEAVFEFILETARCVYSHATGSRVRDIVQRTQSRVPANKWAQWSGAIPVK